MKKGRIEIDEDRCKGCNLCIEECKVNVIKISDKINKYGYSIVEFDDCGKCTACSLCAIMCPDAAIKVIQMIGDDDE